jgi:hypothetical protein
VLKHPDFRINGEGVVETMLHTIAVRFKDGSEWSRSRSDSFTLVHISTGDGVGPINLLDVVVK